MASRSPETMLNIAVLVSGSGTNLQAIIDTVHTGDCPAEVSLVLSNKPAYGLTRAQDAGIATALLEAQSGESREAYDARLLKTLEAYKPDLIVLAGFMRILSADFVAHFDGRMLNIHPSLLPLYKGLNTHQRALDDAQSQHGATVHFVTAELDSGPALIQGIVEVEAQDDIDSLSARVHLVEHKIYPQAIDWIARRRAYCKDGIVHFDGKPLIAPKRLTLE